eukprot:TRINITY_DN18447_c0_g1_i1.p1 TRINITY_DN18447_c0_g1~~TRINITY_DN18447_c0_g1_i1.p1  ORF type:complete len:364 (-),score=67.56 TRINITY_DN18447_c0_g1_i1:47-1138(-)
MKEGLGAQGTKQRSQSDSVVYGSHALPRKQSGTEASFKHGSEDTDVVKTPSPRGSECDWHGGDREIQNIPAGISREHSSQVSDLQALEAQVKNLAKENALLRQARLMQENELLRQQICDNAWPNMNGWMVMPVMAVPSAQGQDAVHGLQQPEEHRGSSQPVAECSWEPGGDDGNRAAADISSMLEGPGGDMPAELCTTVMIRNLPLNYTRAMLLDLLDSEGFAGKYNFVYLPIDFQSSASLGYAFINLVEHSIVASFWATFSGWSNWVLPTRKVCQVSWSRPYQGLEAHLERYRNSPVMHESVPDEYKPVVFENGVRVPYPMPSTKKTRQPQLRYRQHRQSKAATSMRQRVPVAAGALPQSRV